MLTRCQVGSKMFLKAYISCHSTFEAWGYAPQADDEVFVATEPWFTDFRYNRVFCCMVLRRVSVDMEWVSGALLTSLEQTVVDGIHSFEKIESLEEIVDCVMRLPQLEMNRLLAYLERYGNGYR